MSGDEARLQAATLMEQALALLDQADEPHAAALLDHAICQLSSAGPPALRDLRAPYVAEPLSSSD